jgi:hypothetical protein
MKSSPYSENTEGLLSQGKRSISKFRDLRKGRFPVNRLKAFAIGTLLCLALLACAVQAQSQTIPSYRIVALPSGFLVFDVNDSGQVAGCYPGASPGILHAVIYSNGNITDLGVGDGSCARVINNKGDVAGINTAGHIFLWKPALPGTSQPPPQDLGLPPSTYVPYGIQNIGGINDADQIAGSSWSILGNTEGFIWQPATSPAPGAWTELPPDPVNGVLSIGLNAINDLGDVAGQTTLYSRYVGGYTIGYLRTSGGAASVISPYPYWQHCGYNGAQVPTVVAAGINDSGEVVGSHGGNLCNVPVAFIYTSSGGLALHDGSSQTLEDDALGVTNDGRVIVNFLDFSIPYSLPYGLLYMAPGFSGGYYLTQMVRPDCGWTKLYGARISRNTGNIVGGGQTNQGARQAFLMTPLASPPQTTADGCTVPPVNPKPTAVPHVNQPIVEATGPNGASVTLDGSGSTAPNGGALTYSWTGPFGAASGVNPTVTLPVGTSTINLTVTDTLGDTGSASIQITVQDTTPPTTAILSQPSAISGMNSGSFYFVGNDLVTPVTGLAYLCTMDQAGPVPCSSPFLFTGLADGPHTFKVQAIDGAGNKDPLGASFAWTVDTTPPVLTTPGNITTQATSVAGAVVNFAASANDAIAGPVPVTCTPPSGSTFAIGTTTVNCTASDSAGNSVTRSFTVTVSKLSQTLSFAALANRMYGSSPFGLLATDSSGLPINYSASGNCSVTGATVTSGPVGVCTITASQPGNTAYDSAQSVSQSFNITPAPLTISAYNATRLYGQANPQFTATYSGFVNSENPSILTGTLSCTSAATPSSSVSGGPYAINCSGLSSANYAITYVAGQLTISPAPLTITANNATKILNAVLPAFSASYSGFVNGENSSVLAGALSCATTATASSIIGSDPISCSGQTSSNYAIKFVPGTLKIIYAPAGACGHTILPPINADGSTVGKQGRTIPGKFQVCDANGVSIGTPGVVASFYLTQIITGTVTANVEDIVDTNNPDAAFRWDGQQWIFNITTSNLAAGSTYVYTITLNDGSAILFQFGLR